ncbi:MAG: hypothetical protein WC802_01790 [Patescibacteria group bacterium]|jgi:hypothetical protein
MTTAELPRQKAPPTAVPAHRIRHVVRVAPDSVTEDLVAAISTATDATDLLVLHCLHAGALGVRRGCQYQVCTDDDVKRVCWIINGLLKERWNRAISLDSLEGILNLLASNDASRRGLISRFLDDIADGVVNRRMGIGVSSLRAYATKVLLAPTHELQKLTEKTAVLAVLMGALPKN